MAEYNEAQIERLRKAVSACRKRMESFRDERLKAIKQCAGKHYGENAAPDKVPTNFIELAYGTYKRMLAANNPRVTCSTPIPSMRPIAAKLEAAMNKLLPRAHFARENQACVGEAMFAAGCIKTGIADDGSASGAPAAHSVDFDDLVIDMNAQSNRIEELAFIGNRYRVPLDEARKNEAFSAKARQKLKATHKEGWSDTNHDRASDLVSGEERYDEEYTEYTELLDLWLPRERVLITTSMWQCEVGELRSVGDYQLRDGPYRLLGFEYLPGCALPLAPAQMWIDLHDLANRLFRKISRQAERQKTILLARRGAEKDAKNILEAEDGEIWFVEDPGNIGEIRFGGADQNTLATYLQTSSIFNRMAGNLDTLAGLSTGADTLGQEQLLNQNAFGRIADAQAKAALFVQDVVEDLAWLLWTDPITEYDIVREITPNYRLRTMFSPEDRMSDFSDLEIKIDPYSLQMMTPSAKLQTIMGVVNQLIPMLPMMEQQGQSINFAALIRSISKLTQIDELQEILVSSTRQPDEMRDPAKLPSSPPNTTRTYERVSSPGSSSRQSAEETLARQLMTGSAQGSEMAGVVRSAS